MEYQWKTERLALICQQQGQKAPKLPKWQNNTKNTRFSQKLWQKSLNFQKQPKLPTPVLILMRANGIPVGYLKAGINLSTTGEESAKKLPKWQNNTKDTRFSHLNFQKKTAKITHPCPHIDECKWNTSGRLKGWH